MSRPSSTRSARRPRGYIPRVELLRTIIPSGSRSIPSRETVNKKITETNHQNRVWQSRIDREEKKLRDLAENYDRLTPELTAKALPIYRRKLLLSRRMFSYMRKTIVLNVLLQIHDINPAPEGTKAMWKRINPLLRNYEKGEAHLDSLLRNPRMLKESLEGEIIRTMRW